MTQPVWTTACPDWERRIIAGESLIPFEPLFPAESEKALRVFRNLVLVDVAGSPLMGDVSRQWILDFVAAIFGAYDAETGRQLISEFFLLIAKKNTKSTTAAGIMLTALILNWRMSSELIVVAPTVEIANNSFFPARDMIKSDPEIAELMHVQEHYRTITHRTTGATLKIVAADSEAVGGKKGAAILVDELWLFGKRANAENMLREACGGLASRPEGFVIYLSTQSDEAPAGVFDDKLKYARGVRDGRIVDPKFLPVLYEFPKAYLDESDKQFRNPKNFYMTNPNLGASVDLEFLTRELAKADDAGEQSLVGFYAKHLNVEIGMALRSHSWAGAEFWQSCALTGLTLDQVIERSEVLEIGLDGGGLDDMLGLSVVGREEGTGDYLHWGKAWLHPIALKRRKSEAPKYEQFEKAGDLVIVKKPGDDVRDVCDIIMRLEDTGLLDKIGADPVGISGVYDELALREFDRERVVGISQGWKMTAPIKATETRLNAKTFRHCGSALMTWCVGNAKVEPRGNAVVITKQASGTAKIDPLMALFNSVVLLSTNPTARKNLTSVHFM